MMDISAIAVVAVVVVTLCGLAGLVWLINTLSTIQGFIRRTAGVKEPAQPVHVLPTPLETKQHDGPLTVGVFNNWKEGRAKELEELKSDVKSIKGSLEDSNRYQAKARQRIHRRQNAMENSLYYMAGKYEAAGDKIAAKVIQQKLQEGTQEEGGGGDGQ